MLRRHYLELWLEYITYIFLITSFISFLIIIFDILVKGNKQKMRIMNVVWPVTALYMGPVGLYAYWKVGRLKSKKIMKKEEIPGRAFWQKVFISDSHCGAGCTLGDIIGESIVGLLGIVILGTALFANYVFDYIFAFTLGILFQYLAVMPMHKDLTRKQGLVKALKADTLSLTSFEIGLFGWMALMSFVLFKPHLEPSGPTYWFMMQIGMILGFLTSYPVNWYLVTKGIKESMQMNTFSNFNSLILYWGSNYGFRV